jgi:soluble lytic murein transglycosylase-like protein
MQKQKNKKISNSLKRYHQVRKIKQEITLIATAGILAIIPLSVNHHLGSPVMAKDLEINPEAIELQEIKENLTTGQIEANNKTTEPDLSTTEGIKEYIKIKAIENNIDPVKALAISACESGNNPKAKNPNSSASGLWQFTRGTFEDGIRWRGLSGWTIEDRFDPIKSTDMTMWFVKKEGWGRWDCYRILYK